jgi:hypothetical protein
MVRKRTWSNAKGGLPAWIAAAALGAALAFGTTAAHPAEKHHDLHIVIETIDHSKQRNYVADRRT